MDTSKIAEKSGPFGALIAASSLVVALLYVAGFSYRWAYYYNFGVQHLVYDLNFQSFLITAIELITEPRNLLFSFFFIVFPLIVLNWTIQLIVKSSASEGSSKLKKSTALITNVFGLKSSLVVDVLRAALLMYCVFMLSSEFGYAKFREHIIDSPTHPLPKVAVIFNNEEGTDKLAISCGAKTISSLRAIGDIEKIRLIQKAYRTCNSKGNTWRLLYRDDEIIVVFMSAKSSSGRPLTLLLPYTKDTYLVME